MDSRGIVKISDFGVSHFFKEEEDNDQSERCNDCFDAARSLDGSFDDAMMDDEKKNRPLSRCETDKALEMRGMANAGLLTKTEGTYCFWSPEMCQSETPFSGYAADMWAAGVCLYIFVTGRLPFYHEITTELFDLIREGNIPFRDDDELSDTLINLLQTTLHKDPAERAGVGDCLKHPFLQKAREKRILQLSAEFEKSRKRKLIVSEQDIQRVSVCFCCLVILVCWC